jgi:hypothetical protein
MSKRPSLTFGSAKTLTEGMGTRSEQRVTPPKVNTAPSFLNFNSFVPVWVCVAALAILDRLDEVDHQTLGWWLAERQLPSGGFNGRPEKTEDVRVLVHIVIFNLLWESLRI